MGELIKRSGRFQGWEYSETMAAGTNSDAILIPPLDTGSYVSVSFIVPTTGEGKVQFTTSPDSTVLTTAIWQDWPEGVVTETTSDSLISQVTAIRFVRTSGTVGIEIII